MPVLTDSFSIPLEVLVSAIRQEKSIKGIQTEKTNLAFFADMILHIENPMESKGLLKLINEFSKAVKYKFK